MSGEKDLKTLLQTMKPTLNEGYYVFCTVTNIQEVDSTDLIMVFKETEGFTVILKKESADSLHLTYSFVSSWITLTVHSSLEAVGLTAAFSQALSGQNISCNVIAGYYHDHIFVDQKDADKAMQVLTKLSHE